jgi:hypothetical protein
MPQLNVWFPKLPTSINPKQSLNQFRFKSRLVHVSFDVSASETHKREVPSIVEASKTMPQSEYLMITYDYEKEETIDCIRIRFIPFWL